DLLRFGAAGERRRTSLSVTEGVVPERPLALQQHVGTAQADVLERRVAQRGQLPALARQLLPALEPGPPLLQTDGRKGPSEGDRVGHCITFLMFHRCALPVGLAPVSLRA